MSWFKDLANPSQSWSDRLTFIADTSSQGSGVGVRCEIDLGDYKDFDWLWDLIGGHATPGNDIRITEADGVTLVANAQVTTAINTTTRTGVIRFDVSTIVASAMHVYHLYIGNTSAASGWGTVANVTAVDCYLLQDAKGGGYPVTTISGQDPKSGETRELTSKHPTDDMLIGFTVEDLQQRCVKSSGFGLYEEIQTIGMQVLLVDVDQPSMYSVSNMRIGACPNSPDKPLIRAKVSGGSDGSDYGVEVDIGTTLDRRIVRRVGVSVRQTTES